MRMDGLALENMPPLMAPLRFFITAPLFGLLAAALLLLGGFEPWDRWSAPLMAVTHLLTLGFMAMVMVGALFQVLPVLSGQTIPGQRWLAPLLHLSLVCGTLALAGAMLWRHAAWQQTAMLLLGATFLLFLGAVGLRLIHRAGGHSLFAIRLAALSLLLAITLGLALLWRNMGGQVGWLPDSPTTAHIRFALLGWVLLLVMGVSYQVIPMFHVTPDYPSHGVRLLPASIFIALLALSVFTSGPIAAAAVVLLVAAALAYAIITLRLFTLRKRKLVDYTIRFWQLALSCLVTALLLYSGAALWPQWINPGTELLWGILLIAGFAMSVIIGMLHKILPFLCWLHLNMQRNRRYNPKALLRLPTMHDILPGRRARVQFHLHCLALGLLLLAPFLPAAGIAAALALGADFLWLTVSTLKVLRLYQQTLRTIESKEIITKP